MTNPISKKTIDSAFGYGEADEKEQDAEELAIWMQTVGNNIETDNNSPSPIDFG